MLVSFEVVGDPAPWTVFTKRGAPSLGFQRMQSWQAQLQAMATVAMAGREPLTGPVWLRFAFYRPRPAWAPKGPEAFRRWEAKQIIKKPDATNYQKAAEDAMQGILYETDAQVLSIQSVKTYARTGNGFTVCWVVDLGRNEEPAPTLAEAMRADPGARARCGAAGASNADGGDDGSINPVYPA